MNHNPILPFNSGRIAKFKIYLSVNNKNIEIDMYMINVNISIIFFISGRKGKIRLNMFFNFLCFNCSQGLQHNL